MSIDRNRLRRILASEGLIKSAGRNMPALSYMIPMAEKEGAREEKFADGALRVWRWDTDHVHNRTGNAYTKYHLLMGSGSKRAKNALAWEYHTKESTRDRKVNDLASYYERKAKEKAQAREDAKNFQHGLQVGDILSASWGYDQTNVNFYEITRVVGKASVELREVQSKAVRESGHAIYVVPAKGRWKRGSSTMKKRVSTSGSVKINSSIRASKWSGKPMYETSPYAGH